MFLAFGTVSVMLASEVSNDWAFLTFLFFVSIMALAHPRKSFILFLVLIPVHSIYFQISSPSKMFVLLSDFPLLCSIVAVFLSIFSRNKQMFSVTPSCPFIFLFFLIAAVSLLWTSDRVYGTYELVRILLCIGCFHTTVALMKRTGFFKLVLKILIGVAVVNALVSLASVYTMYGVDQTFEITGPMEFYNRFWQQHVQVGAKVPGRGLGLSVPHDTAYFCNLGIFCLVGFALTETKIKNFWIQACIFFILFAGMMSTLTKSTLVTLWGGLIFVCLCVTPLRRRLLLCVAALLCLTVLCVGVSRMGDLDKSIKYTQMQLNKEKSGSSVESRVTMWKRGINKLVHTNGIGYGIGGFNKTVAISPVPDGTHPSVLFDFGLAGFFLWAMIFFQSLIYFLRYLKVSENEEGRRFMVAYLGGYFMMLISWMVTLNYDYVDLYFYMGIGYALSKAYPPGRAGTSDGIHGTKKQGTIIT